MAEGNRHSGEGEGGKGDAALAQRAEGEASWFSDETSLLGEVRRVVVSLGEAPVIPGYSELVRLKAGGQAVVYSARQESTGRRVAVKVVNAGDERARQRFAREIELAASLRHPAIVRVYDSGVASGKVYLVMELVEGPSLERFAEGKDARGVAELMRTVAEAVGYAHQRGVIHRDLKPDNILIDAEGRPRVVDFGLARAEHPASGGVNVTVSGQFVGSLAWSSPEHASGRPDAVDTRSDVYSLGVVLYRLLSGQMPYETSGSLTTALANITGAEPAPMSKSSIGGAIDADLKTIVLTCLSKDPTGRYATAVELAADLGQFLAGEPIAARRETAWRTLNRRAKRFRALIVVAAVALVAVGGLAAWSLAQTREAVKAREETQAALKLAERREQQAGRVAQFLTTILRSPQPAASRSAVGGKDVKVVEVLARASKAIDDRFKEDPAVAASLHMAIGQSYRSLGQLDDAEKQFTSALARAEETLDEQIIADALWNKGALLGNSRARNAEAEPILRRVLALREKAKGPDDDTVLEVKDALGTQLQGLARFAEAEAYFKDTLERRVRLKGETHGDTVSSINNYGAFLRSQGKLEEAAVYMKRAAEAAEQGLGEKHPSTLIAWGNYGNTLVRLDKASEALPILRRVAAGQEEVNTLNHPLTAGALNQLGGALQYYNGEGGPRKEEAAEVFRRCLAAAEASLGPTARNTIAFRNNLANCLSELKQHDEAIALQRVCVEQIEVLRGADHFDTYAMKGNLGKALLAAGRAAEAEPLLLGAYQGLKKVYGAEHEEARSRARDLSSLYNQTGRADDARAWEALGK